MSILQALAARYERQAARGEAPAYGFAGSGIEYAVVLNPEGRPVGAMDLRDTSGRMPRPRILTVPQPVVRSVNIRPNFLWDKTAYSLGIKKDREARGPCPAEREHSAFVAFHRKLLADVEDEGLRVFLAFLNDWRCEQYESRFDAADMLDANIVFCLETKTGAPTFLHDHPAARKIWTRWLAQEAAERNLCLVTGEYLPTEPVHPKVKGVPGAQKSGASIVSFNQDAFTSFGRKQGANAPVSKRAAFAYTSALNSLLARRSRNRIQIGDATTVFWAETGGDAEGSEAAEDLFSIFLAPPTDEAQSAAVRDKLERLQAGRPIEDVAPNVDRNTRFFVLGLAPNAGRLSVRFWHEDTIGRIGDRCRRHWEDLRLDPIPWRTPPAARRLLRETAVLGKAENIPPILGGGLMNAILRGGRYPRSLLSSVLLRMRSDGNINGLRAAICKACLARDHRLGHEKEEVPVSLNTDEKNPAYRLGRLFAVYEGVQRAALGRVNATIKDQFYGSASATPASVFPMLARKAAHHLGSLRKDKVGLAVQYERHLDSIFDGFETAFPRSLGIEEQGRFAIGYYHQRTKLWERKPANESGEAQED